MTNTSFDNKVQITDVGGASDSEATLEKESSLLVNSPVKTALRSHMEKWYPELLDKEGAA